ncbi:OsmC family protein [Actinoalloteichus hymeniacidonis]|uniref:Redox protein, regulator of disulfide bond formation n=1 Tax=Actinoalloteichus hymeniacidonis TaxID=340345 RepID=A0AAC9MYH8_9PSEU|nr:OsmC family protein [Actinoalloteichus hymeniacidonis]AOS63002.1 putative redox protein, regulator of disulfide bond formation [Actinoalloteichus hymeniacidonis]MBB5908963.1 organic hydroperoxide reductase OsmC/OhrA [Actinoalloteichus hymeniacidonis]
MGRKHDYEITVQWTGNSGPGTSGYRAYSRDHDITASGKTTIQASADPAFVGDPQRWNPEDLLVASLSECHMLSYLSLCSREGVVVVDYTDTARGTMEESARTGGRFVEVVLAPVVTVAEAGLVAKAEELHERAHEVCFIANSVNFPVRHTPTIRVEGA